jgi:serine/threonine-protein kinase
VGSDPAAAASARSGPVETPPAPVLPEGPGSTEQGADGQAAAAAAVRTVESLYQALSRQDFSAARALFSGEAANQFDPAFFRQFTRVEVADLQSSSRSAGSVTLDGVVSFFYPDGSLQKEARTFTLDTNSDPPRVVASAFGMVVRPRSPNP